jgi:hypothetical protein
MLTDLRGREVSCNDFGKVIPVQAVETLRVARG